MIRASFLPKISRRHTQTRWIIFVLDKAEKCPYNVCTCTLVQSEKHRQKGDSQWQDEE
jgi:hypothetical protein